MKNVSKHATAVRSISSAKAGFKNRSSMSVEFTKGQLAKIDATARVFGCTPADMVVALTMGNLAMSGRMGGSAEGAEIALSFTEFITDHVKNLRVPKFEPSDLLPGNPAGRRAA